jgi:chromosomal replication initiation ATPase DnaA
MKHTSIIPHVCNKHGITPDELTGPRRYPHLVKARREVIRHMRARDYSLPRIARALHRDHTTILHHMRAMGLQEKTC